MQNHIRNTNLRFNLDKDQQRRAWEYLQTALRLIPIWKQGNGKNFL